MYFVTFNHWVRDTFSSCFMLKDISYPIFLKFYLHSWFTNILTWYLYFYSSMASSYNTEYKVTLKGFVWSAHSERLTCNKCTCRTDVWLQHRDCILKKTENKPSSPASSSPFPLLCHLSGSHVGIQFQKHKLFIHVIMCQLHESVMHEYGAWSSRPELFRLRCCSGSKSSLFLQQTYWPQLTLAWLKWETQP